MDMKKVFEQAAREHLESWQTACDALAGLPSGSAFTSWLSAIEHDVRQCMRSVEAEACAMGYSHDDKQPRATLRHKMEVLQGQLEFLKNVRQEMKDIGKLRIPLSACAKQLSALIEMSKTKTAAMAAV